MSIGIKGQRTNYSLDRLLGRPKMPGNYAGGGNWIQTVQPFQIWEYSQGYRIASTIDQTDSPLRLFLFCQDVPIMVWLHLLYEDVTITDTGADTWVLPAPDPWIVGNIASAKTNHTYVVSSKTNYGPGEAFIGTTLTNGVKAVGYMLDAAIPARGYEDAASNAATMTVDGYFVTMGQIIVGANYFTGAVAHGTEGATRTVIPIILDEPHYTEAVYENDNVIVGAATTDYYVVGLWQGLGGAV